MTSEFENCLAKGLIRKDEYVKKRILFDSISQISLRRR